MNVNEWKSESDSLLKKCIGIFDSKGAEYHANENVFANIERVSASLGVHPEVVIMTYLQKHYDSICSYVKNESKNAALVAAGKEPNKIELSEPIEGRIADAINYLLFLNAHIKSNDNKKASISTADVKKTQTKPITYDKSKFINAIDDCIIVYRHTENEDFFDKLKMASFKLKPSFTTFDKEFHDIFTDIFLNYFAQNTNFAYNTRTNTPGLDNILRDLLDMSNGKYPYHIKMKLSGAEIEPIIAGELTEAEFNRFFPKDGNLKDTTDEEKKEESKKAIEYAFNITVGRMDATIDPNTKAAVKKIVKMPTKKSKKVKK